MSGSLAQRGSAHCKPAAPPDQRPPIDSSNERGTTSGRHQNPAGAARLPDAPPGQGALTSAPRPSPAPLPLTSAPAPHQRSLSSQHANVRITEKKVSQHAKKLGYAHVRRRQAGSHLAKCHTPRVLARRPRRAVACSGVGMLGALQRGLRAKTRRAVPKLSSLLQFNGEGKSRRRTRTFATCGFATHESPSTQRGSIRLQQTR